jgi:SAM-dependent methyltransferase
VREVGDEVREVADAVRDGVTESARGVARAVRIARQAVARWARAAGRGVARGVGWLLNELAHRPPQLWWAMMRAVVWPAMDVLRRAGRSVARRGRILTGREASPGGRRDALRFPKGWRERPLTSAEVEQYYDEWHQRYVDGFGEVLQTFRSKDPADFLVELGELARLAPGQHVLDAGCGVGGPACLYAERFDVEVDAVTLSQAQVDATAALVAERGLGGRVRVRKGDFHRLEDLYAPEVFDVVYFLEAFCHTDHPEVVLRSVATVLRPGGVVFIKDLYRNRGASPEEEADIAVAVRNTEHHCHLNVWPRDRVLDALAATGFEVELDQPFELFPDFDYDTGNDFVNENGIDIFEGRPSTYLQHAAIRARKPTG